jgi:hypothetical protein
MATALKEPLPQVVILDTVGNLPQRRVTRSDGFAVHPHSRTTILSDFQHHFPTEFHSAGNRAIQFEAGSDLPEQALELLIASALELQGCFCSRGGQMIPSF